MKYKTADLCDQFSEEIAIATPGVLQDFGKSLAFHGMIQTVECFEDNSFVRKSLEADGEGKVLVVDGAASTQCALLGDMLAQLAIDNKWSGIIVNGCIRDSDVIGGLEIGVKAITSMPLKSVKKDVGSQNVPVSFCDLTFIPGEWVYADQDGVITASKELLLKD